MHRIIQQIIPAFIDFFIFITFLNALLEASPIGEYSNFAFSRTPALYPKSSPVKCSCFSNFLMIMQIF